MEDIIPIFGARGLFITGRTIPAILTETVLQGETVIFDASQGVFVNAPGLGSGQNGGGLINLENTGSGVPLATVSGSTLSLKSIAPGTNVTFTNDGSTIVINSSAGVSVFYDVLDYTSGTTNLISIPAGSIILSTEIAVMVAFNSAATLTLGTASDPTMLMNETALDLTEANSTFKNDISFVVTGVGNQDISSFFTANGATQGQFSIFIEYALQ